MTQFHAAVVSGVGSDKRCCAPVALALVLDKPLDDIRWDLAILGRRFCGGTKAEWIWQTVENHGYKAVKLSKDCFGGCRTLRTLAKNIPPDRKFLIFTSGHVAAATNGQVHDYKFYDLKRIKTIHEILPKNDP